MKRPPPTGDTQAQRLNRILSLAGLTSRRKADEWIRAGRVRVNGRRVTEPGVRAIWGVDRIQVDDQDVPPPSERLYIMLNKPFGYLSSLSDPEGRPTISKLLKGFPHRVYPVGRLDFDSMGLLLLTNDGQWAHRLTHPSYHIPKTYKVTASGTVSEAQVQNLRKGVFLEDGYARCSKIKLLYSGPKQSVLRMTITQGRNRQVRRMLEAVGHRVVHLIRIGYGPLTLGDLKVGEFRHLEVEEVLSMKRCVDLT